jgi:hypothetical protein
MGICTVVSQQMEIHTASYITRAIDNEPAFIAEEIIARVSKMHNDVLAGKLEVDEIKFSWPY